MALEQVPAIISRRKPRNHPRRKFRDRKRRISFVQGPAKRSTSAANFASPSPAEIRRGRFIVKLPHRADLAVGKVSFSFSDERCVPPEDREEQFPDGEGIACFSRRGSRRHRFVACAAKSIRISASAGISEDVSILAARQRDEKIYRHDLILLGLGHGWPHRFAFSRHARRSKRM